MITIRQLKEEYPQYAHIPDVELAEKLYDKYYDGKIEKNNFFQKVFPNIAEQKQTTADQQIIPRGTIGVTGFIDPNTELNNIITKQNIDYKPSVKDIAIQSGVGVSEGASANARFATSLGYNQEQKALAVKNVLSKLYNQDIEVRIGSNTGELEFFNPETKNYELVNKPGVDLGDFTGMGGDAMVILPDIAATIAGTVYSGGNLPVGITAGALTAGVMEYTRYKLGQTLYNINEDVSDKELLNKAFIAAGVSAGSATLGVGAVKIIKGTANIIKGRFLKGNDIADAAVKDEIAKADVVADSINKTLDKAKINSNLKFTLAQSVDDADMLAAQAQFENINKLGYMSEFKTFNKEQAKALNDYFAFLKSGFNTSSGKPISEFNAGKLIQEVITKRNAPLVKELIEKQNQAENILEKAIVRLPDGSKKETGVAIRSAIDDVAKLYKKNVKVAADNLATAANLGTVGTDIIKNTVLKLSDKAKDNLLKMADVDAILKKDILDSNTLSPSTLRNTLSTLNSKIRDLETGAAAGETVDVGILKTLVKSINKQLRKDAPKEFLDQLDNFNKLVITNKQKLNNELISRITRVDNNKLKIFGDEDIFDLTFKKGLKSKLAAEQLHEVIKNSPDAMSAYKNSIFDFYKKKVIKNNVPNLNAHKQFLKDYDAPLKMFFNNVDYNKISKIGGFKKLLDEKTALRDNTIKAIEKSFEGKLEKLTPQELVNKIYKPNNINEILELKKILAKDPDVYKAFQRSVLTDLNESSLKMSDKLGIRVIDSRTFDKYLNGGGGERGYKVALKEIFNVDFVKNLDLLNNALKITARKAPARGEGVYGSAFSDIIRAKLGQFTLLGRLFTASRRVYAKAAERVMANALLNPSSLKELIELRKLKPSTERAAVILSKLGGSIFIVDNQE
jgi:hypothetical protein|tara:strand:+ start:780 stop:3497 length:2718 start_codon:yes stop_codon:yes gene_type:complete